MPRVESHRLSISRDPKMTHKPWQSDEFVLFEERQAIKCKFFKKGNFTVTLAPGYQGIPENLVINLVMWVGLITLYSVLNRTAKNYSRLALLHKDDQKWSQLIYGNRSDLQDDESLESLETVIRHETGLLSWVWSIFLIKDRHILKKNGPDAVQYLTFQRHIIVLVLIVCLFCVGLILPIHVFGDIEGDARKFVHTTLNNMDPNASSLWVHVILSFLFLPLGVLFMRHFSAKLHIRPEESRVSRTLMIVGVPRKSCHAEVFRQHFREAYPECVIQDIKFAYDIRELVVLDSNREVSTQARMWCENQINATGKRPKMRPYQFSRLWVFGDACGCKMVDALDYYSREESEYLREVEKERANALERPVGFVFVTFETEEMAMMVCKDYRSQCQCYATTPSSSVSKELKSNSWKVVFAPPPSDIFWENLSIGKWAWYIRSFFINFVLFLILFFLTTPFIIVSNLEHIFPSAEHLNPFLSKFLPTMMLWLVAAAMPAMVTMSDVFIAHWTRSSRNHWVMRKIFIFLLFMVLILPSLGLPSAEVLVSWVLKPTNETHLWKCLYLPDSGAFFINYVVTSSFVGTTMELIRFPQLCLFILYTFMSRSKAETFAVQRASLFEFHFGVHYAWYLLIFAITMIYSLSCPLIVPFGLVYLCFKHSVDRYNIYFVYTPSKTNKYIHATAIDFVIGSLILLQFTLAIFFYLRTGNSNVTVATCIIALMSFLMFLGQAMMKCFRDFGPIKYAAAKRKTYGTRPSPRKLSTVTVAPKPAIKKKVQRHVYVGPAAVDGHGGALACGSPMPEAIPMLALDTRAEPVDAVGPPSPIDLNAVDNHSTTHHVCE
ncbi:calcium permeable stress-gated cation channel 1-like isoform X1 [Dermacentor albipictus]|uniref:calcium permeable stress-gated cation channel 1-like isoform X1 n=2 Tax=Dermacentor albipictus TaxID=60249 RepID=UPI0031FDFD37